MTEHAGQTLGNYRIVQLLGQGSVTEVYLGEHIRQKTLAALKVWHNQLNGEESLRFQAEAGRIALLEHGHIVPLLEYGVTENLAFVAMEYASGKSLRLRYHRGRQLSLATIVPIARQLAEALEYAHNAGIVHGDIKPENMFSRQGNEVLLSDFNMASIALNSYAQYNKLEMASIVAYMAPEQLQGQVEKASDQYALAVVIYEWLSGKLPFHGSFTEVATQHMIVPPAPLHTIVPTISSTVEEAVLRALEKDPRKRFRGVCEFVAVLEEATENKPLPFFGLGGNTVLPEEKPGRTTNDAFAGTTNTFSPDSFNKY